MNQTYVANANMQPRRMFLGVPQTDKIQVHKVGDNRNAVITQMILSNSDSETASKVTLTINTIDVMREISVEAGETRIIDLYIVLSESDTVSLQQEKANAVNVTINGMQG